VVRLAPWTSRPRVLDAGCGAGRMSRYLAERGCCVEGVDLPPGMVGMAQRDHPDLVFTVGSLTDLPYSDDEFAGVMLWHSIIHTPPSGQAPSSWRPRGSCAPAATCWSGSSPVKASAMCLRHTDASVTRSTWSVISTRRIRSPPDSRLPVCVRCPACCDAPGATSGMTRPSCLVGPTESSASAGACHPAAAFRLGVHPQGVPFWNCVQRGRSAVSSCSPTAGRSTLPSSRSVILSRIACPSQAFFGCDSC
jgi:hypothetical protein